MIPKSYKKIFLYHQSSSFASSFNQRKNFEQFTHTFIELIIDMFQWKNLELSPEDYQNYVNNEDENQMRINKSNITQLEWSKLYQTIQLQSLGNKRIKKYVLAYENNLIRLLGLINENLPQRQMLAIYQRHNNQLRMHLSTLYDQIEMLHIRNISTTVQFSISRLLHLEEQMIKSIFQKQAQVQQLEKRKNELQMGKASQLCTSCLEQMQKNRNKFLIKQIMAVEESSNKIQELEAQQQSENERQQRELREKLRKQDHEYELQRFYYLNSVEEVLRNRERTLKCNSAPLQSLLSQYLSQILEMLQGSQLSFTPKNLREYDRINKSYETIEDMKALINTEDFYKKVSILIEKPYQNLIQNIQKYVSRSLNKSTVKTTVQTQTTYLTEFNQIKSLQKNVVDLSYQLQSLKQSKNRNQVDMINNLQSLHRLELKYIEVINKNKNLETDNKKQIQTINQLRNQIAVIQANHRSNQSNIIDINTNQRAYLLKQIKILQAKVKHFQSLITAKSQKQIQTEPIEDNKPVQENDNLQRQAKKMINSRSQQKDRKRISLRTQQIKQIKIFQTQLNKFSLDKLDNIQQISGKPKQNILLEVPKVQRSEERRSTIKIYTINPLAPINDGLIHRNSSRKISSKLKENDVEKNPPETARLLNTMGNKSRIKKVPQINIRHGHHISELNQKIKHRRQNSNAERLSIVTGKKIITPNHSQIRQLQSLISMQSRQQLIKKEAPVQYLQNQDQNYVVKINQPQNIQQSSKELVTALLQNQTIMAKPGYHEQFNKLVKFSIKNFDTLMEKNIVGMICDMKFQKNSKIPPKRQSKLRESLSIVENELADPTIDVQCSKIGKRCLQIFFNLEQAEKYERKAGIWSQIDTFIMVDTNFNTFCDKIQSYFDDLKELKPMLYQQSLLFLEKPYYFCQEVQGKDYETKQITIFRESLKSFIVQRNWIKKLFRKLLRLHKLIHKKCHHVQKFLQIIGFFKM